MFIKFTYSFKFATFFLIVLKKGWKRKYERDKDETQKYKKAVSIFEPFFWATKMGTINLIRALMYLGKSVPVKGKEKERQKKEIETQRELVVAQKGTQIMGRACPCLSLCFGSFGSVWRKPGWRRTRRLSSAGSGGWSGAWRRRAVTLSCKL